jgi:hypothetical protein
MTMRRTADETPRSLRSSIVERAALVPPAIHLTWDEALALHENGADTWSAANALRYVARLARSRGDHDRATALIAAARAL